MKMIGILVMAALGSAVVCGCSQQSSDTPNAAQIAKVKSERRPASEVIESPIDPPQSARMMANEELVSADPAYVALSSDEEQWLKRNGFMTKEELRSLEALGENELLAMGRDRADMAATTALGLLRLRGGNTQGAIISLDRAARSGSLFALEQMAFAELKDAQTASGRDEASEQAALIQFAARMEQAKMLGDHRADYYLNKVAGNVDRSRYGGQILQQTTEYMRQMAEDSSIKGVKARGPDTRPNIDQWQRITSNPSVRMPATVR